jgi:hypothetical protein
MASDIDRGRLPRHSGTPSAEEAIVQRRFAGMRRTMLSAIRRFLKDERGTVAADCAVLASVLVLGSALGVLIVRHALEADVPAPTVPGLRSTPPDAAVK